MSGGDLREITSVRELEEIVGIPSSQSADKVRSRLGELHRRWLSHSSFCLVATAAADGSCDVSPKGDQAGFALVLDEQTIALPDRPGSRRVDGFHNVLSNPHAGLLFLIPGRADGLRINGRARIVADAPFFDAMALAGVRPTLALVIDVEQVFLHHTRAFVRSGIWDPPSWRPEVLPPEAELTKALEQGEIG